MNLKRWLSVLLGLGVAAGTGCAHADGEGKENGDRRLPYVDEVKAPSAAEAGEPVEVVVSGNFPTPGWEVADVEVDRKDRRVTIRIWITEKEKGPMIQVLQPFERKVRLDDLEAGTWTVEVPGEGDTAAKTKLEVR